MSWDYEDFRVLQDIRRYLAVISHSLMKIADRDNPPVYEVEPTDESGVPMIECPRCGYHPNSVFSGVCQECGARLIVREPEGDPSQSLTKGEDNDNLMAWTKTQLS